MLSLPSRKGKERLYKPPIHIGIHQYDCAAYNPFFVPEDRFCLGVSTIALCPLVFHSPGILPPGDAVKDRFDALIAAVLTGSGYAVVSSWQVRQALSQAYACRTGRLDEPSARERFYRELQAAYHADAVLYPEIIVVQADCTTGTARWCGAAQKVSTPDRAALELLTGPGYSKVPALSILIHMRDMADRRLYSHAAGLETLQKIGVRRRVEVPAERLLKSELYNRRAVETALGPFVKCRRETSPVRMQACPEASPS